MPGKVGAETCGTNDKSFRLRYRRKRWRLWQRSMYGNFPRAGQNRDEPGNDFEQSVRAGYTFTGQFEFRSAQVSQGQSVLFDLAQDGTGAVYACNIRVP
jgi:hypothetical protein